MSAHRVADLILKVSARPKISDVLDVKKIGHFEALWPNKSKKVGRIIVANGRVREIIGNRFRPTPEMIIEVTLAMEATQHESLLLHLIVERRCLLLVLSF